MYLLPGEVNSNGFGFLPFLILPLIAIAVIALGVYLLRHRTDKRQS